MQQIGDFMQNHPVLSTYLILWVAVVIAAAIIEVA